MFIGNEIRTKYTSIGAEGNSIGNAMSLLKEA